MIQAKTTPQQSIQLARLLSQSSQLDGIISRASFRDVPRLMADYDRLWSQIESLGVQFEYVER